jgi:hypothetical protein
MYSFMQQINIRIYQNLTKYLFQSANLKKTDNINRILIIINELFCYCFCQWGWDLAKLIILTE